jgi:hypothetical protein
VQEQHCNAVGDSVLPKQPGMRQGDHRCCCYLLSFCWYYR